MDIELTIDDLAQRAGVPVRTVRYYIAEGILPPASSRGKSATYGEEHLAKLRLARLLADRRVLLADIREQVSRLTLDEARELLRREEAHNHAAESASPKSPRELVSALLEQARRPASPRGDALIAEPSVIRHYRASAPAPAPPPETSWRRLELAPGLELHVRADAQARYAELIRRIVEEAQSP